MTESFEIALARLEGRVIALTEAVERERMASHGRLDDQEQRIRMLESRPRAITWPEFLTTTVSLIVAAGGGLTLLQNLTTIT